MRQRLSPKSWFDAWVSPPGSDNTSINAPPRPNATPDALSHVMGIEIDIAANIIVKMGVMVLITDESMGLVNPMPMIYSA